jgi:hypothetical protein
VKTFISLFSMMMLVGSVSAFAGDLHGADAAKMASILNAAGIGSIWDVTIGFVSAQNPNCSGENYVDTCAAAFADARPAANPSAIKANDTQEFWSLLKKAGVSNQTAHDGKVTISASRIDCSLYSDETRDDCTVTQ